jgi:hypothetical protein
MPGEAAAKCQAAKPRPDPAVKRGIDDRAGTQPVARKVGAVGTTDAGEPASATVAAAGRLSNDHLTMTGDDAAAYDRPAEAAGAADEAGTERTPATKSAIAQAAAADAWRSDCARAKPAPTPKAATPESPAPDMSASKTAAAAAHAAAPEASAAAESAAAPSPTAMLRIGDGRDGGRENNRRGNAKSFGGHDFDLSPGSV